MPTIPSIYYGGGQVPNPVDAEPFSGATPSSKAALVPGSITYSTSTGAIYFCTSPGVWILISNGGGSGTLTWNSGATGGAMAINNGYIVTSATLQTFTLPAVSAVGDVLELIRPSGAGGWTIALSAGQSIQFASTLLTGPVGALSSTAIGDAVHLVCTTANTTWLVDYSIGSLGRTVTP
jgi:hypothetical protein